MSTLLKPLQVRQELISRGVLIFTPDNFARIFKVNSWQIKYFFNSQEKAGLILKLKRGLYCLKTDVPGEEEIANRLYQPSYLSLEYALSKYNVVPEAVYPVTSVSTKPTRIFSVNDRQYIYLTLKKEAYTGYYPVQNESGRVVLIGEPEKALVDYWYFVSLGKKTDNDRLNLNELDKKKIIKYAGLFNRPGLMNIVNKRL